jgi:hypothetical protein
LFDHVLLPYPANFNESSHKKALLAAKDEKGRWLLVVPPCFDRSVRRSILKRRVNGRSVFPDSQATFATSYPGKTCSLPIFPLSRGTYLLLLLIVACAVV